MSKRLREILHELLDGDSFLMHLIGLFLLVILWLLFVYLMGWWNI